MLFGLWSLVRERLTRFCVLHRPMVYDENIEYQSK